MTIRRQGWTPATRAALKNTLKNFAEKEGTQILAGVNAAAEARRMSARPE